MNVAAPKIVPSETTCSLVDQLVQRDLFGQRKYGASMDRDDLTPSDWCQHAVEEMLDAAGYLTALKREMTRLQKQLVEARGAAQEYALFRASVESARNNFIEKTTYRGGTDHNSYSRGVRDFEDHLESAIDRYDADAALRQLARKVP